MIVQLILRSCGSSWLKFRSASIKNVPAILSAAHYRTCYPCKQSPPSCPSGGSGKHKIKYIPYVPVHYKDHDYKNMAMNRPMSPHLDVYGATLPAMTSIFQRATGIGLTCFSLILAGTTLLYPGGVTGFVHWIQSYDLPEFLIIGVKSVISLCFCYHYFIGIRFVLFNMGKLLCTKECYSSAYVAMAATAVFGVGGALIGHVFSWE